MTVQEIRSKTLRAHELYGDYWFNSEPIPVTALKGRVLLLHFWDYCSVSSLRTLPYVLEWHRKYEPFGLVVIGVHVPRYEFAADPMNASKAIAQNGIPYPIVLDNRHLITGSYDVRSTPTLILVDSDGFVRSRSAGDRDYEGTEHSLQSLLREAGADDSLPLPMQPLRDEDRHGAVYYRVTPELSAGYSGRNLGNSEGLFPESVVEYSDPGLYVEGKLYAEGRWFNGRTFLRLSDGEAAGRIFVRYNAAELHAVLGNGGDSPAEIEVLQDGKPLTLNETGEDVRLRPDGRSIVSVDEPRLYSLIRNAEFGDHTACLIAQSDLFSFYSCSFVSAVIPESVSRN